jgi:hypothetical protein
MAGFAGQIQGPISNHRHPLAVLGGKMATVARGACVGSFQWESGFLMVESRDLVLLGSVTISAVLVEKLESMGPLSLMASGTAASPPRPIQEPMVEPFQGKDGWSVTKVTTGLRERVFVRVLRLVANGA